jgi:DNA ligase 1
MLLAELIDASRRVAETRSRLAKVEAMAQCLRRIEADEMALGVAYLSGDTAQGKVGIGYAMVREAWNSPPAPQPSLNLSDVHAAIGRVASLQGAGSSAARKTGLRQLFERATAPEQEFLGRLLLGELRQGALEGIMLDALARAAGLAPALVRRAAMRAGSISLVARAALTEGAAGLERFALTVFQPVQPMLAQPADDVADALGRLGVAAFEWKIDGVRVQVHKSGSEVHAYTRSLNEVTAAVPEIVAAVQALPAQALILDGETVALKADGTPHPFQDTMRRFARKLDIKALRATLALSVYFFDCLLADESDLTAQPLQQRINVLTRVMPGSLIIPRIVTSEAAAAQAFFDDSLRRGHEGVMAKSLTAPYEGGSRGSGWLKIKKANTLDLVVLAVEWGSGRRSGWLSNLHLGAYDPAAGSFVMLGKTFKGMSDAMLAWQTGRLLGLEAEREGHIVHVRPELVVEIAFNEIQASPNYPAGLALRFARVKRYRDDKRPEQADTVATVRSLYEGQLHRQSSGAAQRFG